MVISHEAIPSLSWPPNADSLQQLGRGLAGALIIEDREPIQVDRELLRVLSDWRLNAEGQLAAGFGNAMEAAMAGRIGNVTTVNGRVPGQIAVRAGERIRLRLINTALARIMGCALSSIARGSSRSMASRSSSLSIRRMGGGCSVRRCEPTSSLT